jgi:poly-gamma-glutamate synthesis protein (capsule biosynthesis protein)
LGGAVTVPDPIRLLEPRGEVTLTLAAIGDVGVAGRARARAARDGLDAVFAAVAGPLRAADVGFANLELPVADPQDVRPGRNPEFHHDDAVPAALARAGVNVVSLANNHLMDFGPRGLERTRAACAAAGLLAVGAGATLDQARAPARLTVRGRRVVVAAYAAVGEDRATADRPGVAPLDPALVARDLAALRAEADVLVVSLHWGSMYVDYPPPRVLDAWQAIAPHADVVLGHHPHVTQGWRREGGRLVLFSLGDACFDAEAGDVVATVAAGVRSDSGVFTVRCADEPGLDLAPVVLDPDGVPSRPDAARRERLVARLVALAAGLDEARERFAAEGAPRLVRYELESLATHLRRGRLDRALALVGSLRPRHLPVLWKALWRRGRP